MEPRTEPVRPYTSKCDPVRRLLIRSYLRQLPERLYLSHPKGRIDRPPAFPLSAMRRIHPLVRQHSAPELALSPRPLPRLQTIDLLAISTRGTRRRPLVHAGGDTDSFGSLERNLPH